MTWHATWQVNDRSTTAGPPVNGNGQRWPTTVNGGGPPSTTAGPPSTTAGPPPDHLRTTARPPSDLRWNSGLAGSTTCRVRVRSGSGRVWIGSVSQKQLHFQIQLSISKLSSSQEFLFKDEVSLSQATVHADYSQAKEGILRPSYAELRLMTSGHEKGGTSQAAVVRSVRKVLCGRTGVFGVKRVRRLLIIQF
ncbi:protein NAR1 isoform X2 [Tanacetum coccineum]